MSRHYIRKREGPRGVSWYATVTLGRDPVTGKLQQKHLSAQTRKALEAKIAGLIAAHDAGQSIATPTLTVGEHLARWLDAVAAQVKPTTLRRYRECVERELVPALGAIKLVKLTPADVHRMESRALKRGLSPTTVVHLHYVLRRALELAVRWNLLPRNVCDAVDPPRRAEREMTAWTVEQAVAALAAADGDDLEALWRLALTTGMRRGELLGLRWSDVDLDRGQLAIRHTLVRGEKGKWESSTPKTTRSRRTVALSETDQAALVRHRDRQRLRRCWREQGYVFTNDAGEPLHANTLQRRFRQWTARAGLPVIRFHDLRHTAATLMLAAGEHPKIVSERLGHSTVSMTLDRYSHVTESMQRDAAERLDALLRGAS